MPDFQPKPFTTECGCNRYPCDHTGCDCGGEFHNPGPDCPGQHGRNAPDSERPPCTHCGQPWGEHKADRSGKGLHYCPKMSASPSHEWPWRSTVFTESPLGDKLCQSCGSSACCNEQANGGKTHPDSPDEANNEPDLMARIDDLEAERDALRALLIEGGSLDVTSSRWPEWRTEAKNV